jgi:hypothetical protein
MTISITKEQIKKIKTLARLVFGDDDGGYRDMLWGQAQVKSCKALKGPKIDLVIRHLERCAGQEPGRRTMSPPEYVHRLWGQVSYAPPGAAREKALKKFLVKRFQIWDLQQAAPVQVTEVIEALKAMRRRRATPGTRDAGGGQ